MATILATVDIEDLATPKVSAIRDALSDLTRMQEEAVRSAGSLTEYVNNSVDALGASAVQSRAAAQGLREVQTAANALTPQVNLATGAIVNYLSALAAQTSATSAANEEIKLYGGALAALSQLLQAGTRATHEQALAFQELAQNVGPATGFTAEQARRIEELNEKIKQNIPLTQQEVQELRSMAEAFAVANREALGLGTATRQLVEIEQRAKAEIFETAKALDVLQQQMKRGAEVTHLQAAALQELAERARQGGGFTEKQAQQLQQLTQQMQAGTAVTGQQANALQALAAQFNAANIHGQQATTMLGKFKVNALAAIVALGVVAAGMTAFIKQSIELASRIETLGIVMVVTAKNAHLSNFELQTQVEAIKRLGITTREATEGVLQFVQAELKVADAAKLARVAQDLAVVAGSNSSQAFDRLLRAINTQQPELLRTFGIVTGVHQALQKYALELGKTERQLGPLERKQAILNLILAEGEKVAGAYEASMTTAGKQVGSMARLTEELSKKTGEQLMPIYTALVAVVFKLLEALNQMPPVFFAVVAGVGVTIAAFAAMKTAILVGLVPALKTLAVALLTTPVGLVATALGAAVTALVYFTRQSTVSVQKEAEKAAAYKATADQLDRQRDKIVELEAKQGAGTASVKELERAYLSLQRTAPNAVERVNNQWVLHNDQVDKAISSQKELMRLTYITAQSEVTRLQAEAEAQRKAFDASEERLAKAKADAARATKPDTIARTKQQVEAAMASVSRNAESLRETLSKLDSAEPIVAALAEEFDEVAAKTGSSGRALEKFRDLADKFGADRVNAELRKMQVNLQLLVESSDAFAKAGPDAFKMLLEQLGKVAVELDEQDKKNQQAREKYRQAYESALESIRGTAARTQASLKAANVAFGEVSQGSQEYLARLQRGRGSIEEFNKLTDKQKQGLDNVAKAAAFLKQLELGELFDQWAREAQVSATEAEKAWTDTLINLQRQRQLDSRATDRIIIAAQRESAEEIRRIDQEIFEEQVVFRMKGVDQAIYHEQRRVEEVARALQIERQLREDAFDEEAFQIKQRFEAIQAEMMARNNAVRQSMALKEMELELDLAARVARGQMSKAEMAEQLQAFNAIRQQIVARINASEEEALQRIRIEEGAQQEILQRRRDAAKAEDALRDRALQRQRDASARTVALIRDQVKAIKIFTETVVADAITIIASGLTRMLTGVESWADGFKAILRSIRDAFFSFVDDMIKKWVNDFIQQALGRQLLGGSQAGAMGLLGNLGKMISGWFGRGSAAPMVGGAYAGMPGAIASQGASAAVYGSTAAAATPWWATAAGGGLIAAGAGGLAGYGVGSMFNSRTGGALAGAATGAGTGALLGTYVLPGIGTAVGALIGGIAGLIGGIFGGGKEKREVQKARAEFLDAVGGIAKLKTAARAAGVEIDKLLSTDKMETFRVEAQKVEVALRFGSMDELRKRAQLVGKDIDKIFNIERASAFNREMKKLNLELEESEKRLQGLATAAAGLQQRTEGFAMGLGRDFERIYAGLGPKVRTTLEEAFRRAVENGFQGTNFDFIMQKMREVSEGAENIFNIPPDAISDFKEYIENGQEEFNRLGMFAAATFSRIMRETGDLNAAMEAIGGTLDILIGAQTNLGFTTDESFRKLLEFRKVMKVNEDVAMSLSGITQILKGMVQAGGLTQEMFSLIGQDVVSQFDKLMNRGVEAPMAMMAVQPVLQQLFEAQKKYGYVLDENTQKLVDQAVQQGIVGDQFKETNEKILDVLLRIADALGADIPDALRTMDETSSGIWARMHDRATKAALGSSPGGIRELVTQTNAAITAFAAYRDRVLADTGPVEAKVATLAEKLKGLKDGAMGGGSFFNALNPAGAVFGLGGGGSSMIRDVADRLSAERGLSRDERFFPAVPADGEPVALDGTERGVTVHLTIQQGDYNIALKGLDGADIARVWEQELRPRLKEDLDNNNRQLAVDVERAISRYRERKSYTSTSSS